MLGDQSIERNIILPWPEIKCIYIILSINSFTPLLG